MIAQSLLAAIPITVMGIMAAKNKRTFTPSEYVVGMLLGVAFAVGGYQWARYLSVTDTEHWNGRITSLDVGTQDCCHCVTICDSRDDDGNCTSSHEECDHILDDWYGWSFSTGDRLRPWTCHNGPSPARWRKAQVGDVAALEHSYLNYLYADKTSVLGFPAEVKGVNAPTRDLDGDGKLTVLDYPVIVTSATQQEFATGEAQVINPMAD